MSKIYPYGGFWKRFAAFLIDAIILTIPFTLIYGIWMVYTIRPLIPLLSTATAGQPPSPELLEAALKIYSAMFGFQIISLIAYWLYHAFMESSRYQATLGKMVLGIKVVGEQGQRISFWHATGRTFAKWVSALTLYVGFLMAGATRRKQALHDIIASTYVVDKTYEPGQPLPEVPSHYVLLVISFIAIWLLMLLPVMLLGWFIAHSDGLRGQEMVPARQNFIEPVNNTLDQQLPAIRQLQDKNVLEKLPTLQQLPAEQKQPFTENDYAFTFEDNGTVRAQHTDNDYALLMRPDENWPCCQPLVPDGCAEIVDATVCQAR